MTNRKQYERMIYLEPDEVEILMAALVDTWYHWGSPDDEEAMKLFHKIAAHYNIKGSKKYIGEWE